MIALLLTINCPQRHFIVVVCVFNGAAYTSPPLTRNAIGRSPHIEYHYLGCALQLLYIPRNLLVLVYAIDVLHHYHLCMTLS